MIFSQKPLSAFPDHALAGKSAAGQKSFFFRCGLASQQVVAMREAAEAADDLGVILGISEIFGIGLVSKQLDAADLVRQMLRMHERQIEKLLQHRTDPRID